MMKGMSWQSSLFSIRQNASHSLDKDSAHSAEHLLVINGFSSAAGAAKVCSVRVLQVGDEARASSVAKRNRYPEPMGILECFVLVLRVHTDKMWDNTKVMKQLTLALILAER